MKLARGTRLDLVHWSFILFALYFFLSSRRAKPDAANLTPSTSSLLFFLVFFIGLFLSQFLVIISNPRSFSVCARRYQMWSSRGKFSLTLKELKDFTGSSFPSYQNSCVQDIIDVSSSSSSLGDDTDDENDRSNDSASKQLVLYDPIANSTSAVELAPDPLRLEPHPSRPRRTPFAPISSVLPSVGAFTVQCANCFKWRLIPTKEKYEEIREHILELPFVCETAREWRPDISCDDPEDISQDGSKLWAIDKPNIAQPPPGWERLLRIRGEGSTKFADIYYVAPSGKRLRSMVEIQKYLLEHPEFIRDGVTLSRFSFQIPRPLQENYVRKRPARLTASYEGNGCVEPEQVNPLAWVGPDDCMELQHSSARHLAPCMGSPSSDSTSRPAKKQATESSIQKQV